MRRNKIRSKGKPQQSSPSIAFVGGDADKELERYEKRAKWLADHGRNDSDVLFDEDKGLEYIPDEHEDGTPGEDGYGFRPFKNYLPDDIQSES